MANIAAATTATLQSVTDVGSTTTNAIRITNTTSSAGTNSGALIVTGGVGIGGNTYIGGSLYATTKSFYIDHPTKDGMKLRYGSLESPYHGVRLTGEAVIISTMVRIDLPDYIKKLCKQPGSQVQITNINHGNVLWVSDINIAENYFTIGCKRPWLDKQEYRFYWSFTAVRDDIADLEVEGK